MKLLWSTENKIVKDKNGENVPHLEITYEMVVYCNLDNNNYQQNSRVLYTFVSNKQCGQFFIHLLQMNYLVNHYSFIFLKTFNSKFSCIEVWFTYRNSKLLETEDKIRITEFINSCNIWKWDVLRV